MSDFIQRSEVLLGEISKEFESLGLTKLYLDYYKNKLITYEKMIDEFDNLIKSLSDNEDKLEELNYMNKTQKIDGILIIVLENYYIKD